MSWTGLNLGHEEPSFLRLNVIIDGDISGEIYGDLIHGEIILPVDVAKAIQEGTHPHLGPYIVQTANELAQKNAINFTITLSSDLTPLKLTHGQASSETKEDPMAKSAAIQILKKKKAGSGTAEVEPETQEAEAVETEQEETPAPKAAKKPAGKKAASPKAKATTTTKDKVETTAQSDEIADTAAAIENMTEEAATSELRQLLEAQSFDEFRMGGILAKIQTENWFGEYDNFRSLVEAEYHINYRKAMYLVGLYNDLVESGVPWAKVKHLGWTKLKDLAGILTTDNADEVLKAVDGMNALQVAAYVDSFKSSGGTSTNVPADQTDIKSKTFKLFPAQKETVELAVEKAKKDGNTDSDGAALEYIATDFLAGAKKKAPATKGIKQPETTEDLVPLLKPIREGSEEISESLSIVLQAIGEVWPEAQIQVELEETE